MVLQNKDFIEKQNEQLAKGLGQFLSKESLEDIFAKDGVAPVQAVKKEEDPQEDTQEDRKEQK